jgi:mannose-P-dolichol utilization defect protein 1
MLAQTPDSTMIAKGLGYLIGAGSLLLYAPIALRVVRTKDANGLTLSTWWLKLLSYTCSDVYSFTNAYPLSTYVETLIITVEAAIVLALVAWHQNRLDASFCLLALAYVGACAWSLTAAPAEAVAFGQAAATLLNTGALLPQLALNLQRRSPGGYSPITAALACTGCLIRLFTTVELTGADPLLLAGFGFGFALNATLLGQIVYYGVAVEGKPLGAVIASDFAASSPALERKQSDSSDEMKPFRVALEQEPDL